MQSAPSPELDRLLEQVADEVIREALRRMLARQVRLFKLWERLSETMQGIAARRRCGRFGILVAEDADSLQYQYLEAMQYRIACALYVIRADPEYKRGILRRWKSRKELLKSQYGLRRAPGWPWFSPITPPPDALF